MNKPLKIIFAGTPKFAAAHLETLLKTQHNICLVLTQQDKESGRGRKIKKSEVKELARKHNLPLLQPETLKDRLIQDELRDFDADLMVVAAYGLLLPKEVLEIPKYGCINVHASLLPRWRGAAPIQRAIMEGDDKTGITIMQVDEGLDTGAMLLKGECSIEAEDTAKDVHDKLVQIGPDLLAKVLEQMQNNALNPEKQSEQGACYAKKIEKEDAKIDWHKEAETLLREIRAFSPWPISYCRFEKQRVRILKASVIDASVQTLLPGTITKKDDEGIRVATGEGLLNIELLQFPGKKPLEVAEVLRGKGKMFSIWSRFT